MWLDSRHTQRNGAGIDFLNSVMVTWIKLFLYMLNFNNLPICYKEQIWVAAIRESEN